MKNVTLSIEDDVIDRARAYAARKGTTLNAIVRQHLQQLGENEERLKQAMAELRALSEQTIVRLGPDYRFNRDDAYAERLLPGHQRPDLRGDGTS